MRTRTSALMLDRSVLTSRRVAALMALALVAIAAAALGRATPATAQTPPPRVGIVCTRGGTGTSPIFNLTTKTGYISLPDGNTSFMWGYSSGFDAFQHPGPTLCVNEGDTVTVVLHNTLPAATSIVFPGRRTCWRTAWPRSRR